MTDWIAVCRLEDIQRERGVCALVANQQVAVVRTHDDVLYAVGQEDPFSGAMVLSRGIVGSRVIAGDTVPVLQSPMFKQSFDLTTGVCLDDAAVKLPVHPVRLRDGLVEVGPVPVDD